MNWPTREEFTEVRRLLPLVAAALFVAALAVPMWVIEVHAVQYPDQVLKVHLYAYPHLTGDYAELATLNHYVGFYYPDPVHWTPNYEVHPNAVDVPEWSVGPVAFVAVAALSLFVALAPTAEKLKRGLKWQLAGTLAVFGVMLADIQYRLYQTGHSLDPGAPVMGVDPFTPPLWGTYEVANLTTYSRLGPGAYVSTIAIGLLVVAYRCRTTDATVADVPGLVSAPLRGEKGGREAPDDDRRTDDDRAVTEAPRR